MSSLSIRPGPEVIKLFFRLNSTEHDILTAHKTKLPTNEEVSCFKSLRSWHFNIFEHDKFRAQLSWVWFFITLGPSCPLQIIREMQKYKNRRRVVSDCRPVSVLPIVSKLERAVSTQLEGILSWKIFSLKFYQDSGDICLTYLTDYIKAQTSKGLYTGMIMLDKKI